MNLAQLHEVRAQVGQAQLTRDRQRLRQQWPLRAGQSTGPSPPITHTTPGPESGGVSPSTDGDPTWGGALRALGSAPSDPSSPWSQNWARVLDPESQSSLSRGPESQPGGSTSVWIRCQPQEAQRLSRCYQLGVKLLNPGRTLADRLDALDLPPARCAQWADALADRGGCSLPPSQ